MASSSFHSEIARRDTFSQDDINEVIAIWKRAFPNTVVLAKDPKNKWFLFTHTLAGNTLGIPVEIPAIDGVRWQNPLNQNALGTMEIRDGKIGNWYEVILHDVPGLAGVAESSTAVYVNTLNKLNIFTDGDHYHNKGHCGAHHAIHDHSFTLSPTEFSRRSIEAFKAYSRAVQRNHYLNVCDETKSPHPTRHRGKEASKRETRYPEIYEQYDVVRRPSVERSKVMRPHRVVEGAPLLADGSVYEQYEIVRGPSVERSKVMRPHRVVEAAPLPADGSVTYVY